MITGELSVIQIKSEGDLIEDIYYTNRLIILEKFIFKDSVNISPFPFDNGKHALRPEYHKNYYGALVLDPDGHSWFSLQVLPSTRFTFTSI